MKILITGTSSGIGYGLALKYLEHKHDVYGISRHHNEKLDEHKKFRLLLTKHLACLQNKG